METERLYLELNVRGANLRAKANLPRIARRSIYNTLSLALSTKKKKEIKRVILSWDARDNKRMFFVVLIAQGDLPFANGRTKQNVSCENCFRNPIIVVASASFITYC